MLLELSTMAYNGCRLSLMSESPMTENAARGAEPPTSTPGECPSGEGPSGETPKRRAGAPCGNRNALKHGRYSAAAQAARAAARARLLAAIPDPNVHSSRWQTLAGGGGSPLCSAFKGNNYVAQRASPGPVPPDPRPLPPVRPRGAPPGNNNALKHGRRSGKRRALWKAVHGFMRAVRACLAEVDARHAEACRKAPRSMMDEAAMHAHALTPFAATACNQGFRERPPHAA
jgi:hypothetical protein